MHYTINQSTLAYLLLITSPSIHSVAPTLMMIMKSRFPLLSLFIILFSPALAQELSPAQAPTPSKLGPINVVKILTKAGNFKTFVRLLKQTQLDSNLNNQLGDSNNGITIFAPDDAAFAKLKRGTVGTLTRQEKLQLAQFHIVPVFISRSDFDSVSSPVQTHAGSGDLLQLNVTRSGGGSVGLATGVTNTTLSDTVYLDTHLAIYQVDKVLLPMSIFGAPERAQSPGPAAAKGSKSGGGGDFGDDKSGGGDGGDGDGDGDGDDDADGGSGKDASGAVGVEVVNSNNVIIAVFVGLISVAFVALI